MNIIKKATKAFIAGFDHANPKRHTNLKCSVDFETTAEGEHKPVLDMIRLMRDQFQFEHVVRHIEAYQHKALYNGNGERLHIIFAKELTANISRMDAKTGDKTVEAFRNWANRNPNCPYAITALAAALNEVGWIHRGGGYANTVTEEGARKFLEYTKLSQEVMRYAGGRHSNHWYWNYTSLRNVTEDNVGIQEVYNRYTRVAPLMPQSPSIYSAVVRPLLPRWGGNYEILEALANQCARDAAPQFGDGGYSYAYSTMLMYGEDVRDLHINRERFSKGCRDWLRVLPSDYLATEFAGNAYLLGDYNLCLDILESLDVFYYDAHEIEPELTLMNSICRIETGR